MKRIKVIDSLMPETRSRILAILFGQPREWRYLRELAAELELSPSTIQNDIHKFIASGILEQESRGNRSYIRPNISCNIYPELLSIMQKTSGLVDIVRDTLMPFRKQIDLAFIFGSIARKEETNDSDVDLMLIGEITLGTLALPLRDLERTLHRPINPIVLSKAEAQKSISEPSHFFETVFAGEKLWLMENDYELASIFNQRSAQTAHNKRA